MARLINKADQNPLLKPWRCVDFNKDGSVKSVRRVDSAKNDSGGYRQYVQADTDEEAIGLAKALLDKYERRREKQRLCNNAGRERKRAAGICEWCPNPAAPGRMKCPGCLSRDSRRSNAQRASDNRRGIAKTPEQKVLQYRRELEVQRAQGRRRSELAKTIFGSSAGRIEAYACLSFAREALAEYDRLAVSSRHAMPDFREWLVARVSQLEGKIAACNQSGKVRHRTEPRRIAAAE